MTPFATLVRAKYLDVGFNKIQAFSKIYLESGASINSIRAAFNGTRVQPETAHALATWAKQVHRVDLDELALVSAPRKERRHGRGGWFDRGGWWTVLAWVQVASRADEEEE